MLSRLADVVGLVATPLTPSHYLSLFHPLWGSHALSARVESVHDETADARTLRLRPGRGFRRHRAGQHVRVGVTIDGRIHTRTYSISSAADAPGGCIAITVKAIPGGRVSGYLARAIRPGAYVTLGQPEGDFVVPDDSRRPLFVTGGSGITPIMSMLRTFAARGAMPSVVHVHYAPHARDVIFAGELARLAAAHPSYRLHVVRTREFPENARHFGGAQLDVLCPDWRARDAWACGPASLLDAVTAHYEASGHAARLHVERFGAKLAPVAPNAIGGDVRFTKSGKQARADGKTPLLRVAESAGVAAPHGCRMGICRSCDARVVSGCVRDLRTGRTEGAGARVQVCVSAAAGDVEIEL